MRICHQDGRNTRVGIRWLCTNRRDVIIEIVPLPPPTDENGPYYWHVKSGNIQREPPEAPPHSKRESRRSLIKDNDSVSKRSNGIYGFCIIFSRDWMLAIQINNFHTLSGMVNTVTRSNTSSALDQELENKRKVELALK